MTVKLKEIIGAVPALSKLSSGDLNLRLAYQVRKTISALQKEVDFFSEQRQKIFEKYGTADEDGTYRFGGDSEQEAVKDLDALLALEVSPECETIDIPVSEELRLSANDLDALAPFIHFTE